MTDREKLLTALLRECDHRDEMQVSVLDVIAIFEALGAEHRRLVHHEVVVRTAA